MSTHSFPLDRPINVSVRVGAGSVRVETADGLLDATVELEGDPETVAATTVELRGSTLTVSGPRQGGVFDLGFFGARRVDRGRLEVRVVVPSKTAVRISTFTAPIVIAGTVAGADLAFAQASATVGRVAGDLRLRFGGGRAVVDQVEGAVVIRSGAGDVVLGEVGGDLASGCGSGDLTVADVRGAARVRAGSGRAAFAAVHGDLDLASGSGQLEIGVPGGVSASLDVQTGLGSVRSELPIEDAAAPDNAKIAIRARTANGDIRLFRAA